MSGSGGYSTTNVPVFSAWLESITQSIYQNSSFLYDLGCAFQNSMD